VIRRIIQVDRSGETFDSADRLSRVKRSILVGV